MFSLTGPFAIESYTVQILLSLLCAFWMHKRYGLPAALFMAWTSFCALRLYAQPESPYMHEDPAWLASFSAASATALAFIFLVIIAIRTLHERTWVTIFQVTAIVNAILIIAAVTYLGEKFTLMDNYSMSGCLAAASFPLFFIRKKIPMFSVILIPAAILITEQSQPIALIFIVFGIWLLRQKMWKEWLSAIGCSLFVGAFVAGDDLFSSSGRTAVWEEALKFFHNHTNPFLGAGLSAFYYIGPWLTVQKYGQGWTFLHSDWLQIFLEQGFPGIILAVVVFAQALYKARYTAWLFTSLVTFGCFGVANFPLHNPISALFGAFLFHTALGRCESSRMKE